MKSTPVQAMFDSHSQHENSRSLREAALSRVRALLDADPEGSTDEKWYRTLCTAYFLLTRESTDTDDVDSIGRSVCGECLHLRRDDHWCKARSGYVDLDRWSCLDFYPR